MPRNGPPVTLVVPYAYRPVLSSLSPGPKRPAFTWAAMRAWISRARNSVVVFWPANSGTSSTHIQRRQHLVEHGRRDADVDHQAVGVEFGP